MPREYSTVLIFDVLTGLRPTEAVNSCKLITELSEKGKLNTYLDRELMMLQHFRFPELFLRNSKNAAKARAPKQKMVLKEKESNF